MLRITALCFGGIELASKSEGILSQPTGISRFSVAAQTYIDFYNEAIA